MSPGDEKIGEELFRAIIVAARHFGWTEILMLKSAWAGKLEWSELPDRLRGVFVNVANQITAYVNDQR